MLGHVYVTFNGHTVQVSHKGAALLSYLALEGQSHHREHLADLLWDHPQSLRNLRVELTRLKQQGISPFPARQPMLSLNCPTDLEQWTHSAHAVTENTLPDWLARVRGFPLSGLEDVGSSNFRNWLDQQRWRINETMERTLTEVYTRFSQRGQAQALALIRERAGRLGFTLPDVVAPSAPLEGSLVQHHPQQAELRRIAQKAQDTSSSQLVFLHGLPGTPRSAVAAAFQGTPWKAMQVQMGPQRRLVQAALIQQLVRTLPEYKAPLLDLLGHLTEEGELDLIQISAVIARAAQPLILALHVIERQPWLTNAVRFVLDFPHPMVVVLCTSSEAVRRELQGDLGGVDWTQLHHLSLPAVGAQGIQWAMQQQAQPCTPSQASRWAQCTEGWPLYFQTLWDTQALPLGRCPSQPDAATHAVLTDLHGLSAQERGQLSRLAQIQDRFDVAQAAHVLAEPDLTGVLRLLRLAREQGLLVPAAAREDVQLPGLTTWVNDLETHLAFVSETVRVAFARQLPAPERHQLRVQLSEYYQHRCPAMHQLYAVRAGLSGCPVQAEGFSGVLPTPDLAQPEPSATIQARPWRLLPGYTPSLSAAPRQELRTPNGYRVALEGGLLEVLRKGRLGPAPLLALPFGPLSAGHWELKVRIDLLRNHTPEPQPYALGIGDGGSGPQRHTVAPPAAPEAHVTGLTSETATGQPTVLPAEQWILLSGESSGGPFELTVQAMDVALTISELTWNGHSLLGSGRMQA
ncbi:hypothetical protein D3875_08860 [Deinococcus cavernae]|uniref:Uncharacterized protein n=2 Tax=Deinococcus cavernae TaxID=2320857 RepID=A0A418V6E4_9DEIO|nr:hypothetical protein D3875_08860 [Deinococcus cavernae]